jgi:hypothetical protein
MLINDLADIDNDAVLYIWQALLGEGGHHTWGIFKRRIWGRSLRQLHAGSGTESSQTLCWRKTDSNSPSRVIRSKVLRSLHVVPANVKSARTSGDTGEPAVGDGLPVVAHRMNGGGHRRPARSSSRSGDPADRYAMRALVGQPFHPASPSAPSTSALMSLFVGASGLSSC